MKTPLKFLSMFAFIALFVTTSCSDDDEDEAPAPTRTQLLTAKQWKLNALTVEPALDIDGDGTQENNLIPFIPACDLDDIQKFNTDGTYTFEEGPTKCDPNNPQVYESGTWQWNTDQTRLVTNSGGSTSDVLVTSITSTAMVQTETVVENNVTYTFTYTFN